MSMTEADWLAAMDAEPESARCMATLSDWWQERADPRWEPMGELARLGKVGSLRGRAKTEWFYCGGRWDGIEAAVIDPDWLEKAKSHELLAIEPSDMWRIAIRPASVWRLALCDAWVAANVATRKRWLYVTSLSVEPDDFREASRKWLANLAERLGTDYGTFMENADNYQRMSDFYWSLDEEVGMPEELWSHWAVVTGRTPDRTGEFFRCSC